MFPGACANGTIGGDTPYISTVGLDLDELKFEMLARVARNLSSPSQWAEAAREGTERAMTAEAIWDLPALLRSGWDLIASWRMGAKMAGVRAPGQAGEAAAGILKNTKRIPSVTGASYRVPDILDHANKIIGEAKNYTTTTVSLTAQLKDDLAYAASNGYTMELRVRQGAQLSQPCSNLLARAR